MISLDCANCGSKKSIFIKEQHGLLGVKSPFEGIPV